MAYKNPEDHKKYCREYMRRPEQKAKTAARYQENAEYIKAYQRERRRRKATMIKDKYLARRERLQRAKDRPCVDCGGTFPPVCMDFDHVRGDKRRNVGNMHSQTDAAFEAEVAKCDIVCANCHRIRTWERGIQRGDKLVRMIELVKKTA